MAVRHDPAVALQLIYMTFTRMLARMVLLARSDTAKEIEILVLRHQLGVLQRGAARPRMNWADRALMAAPTRLLPTRRRLGLLVTPATVLRWHRRRVSRRWTTQPAPRGRPAIPAGLRALAVRLATENPPGDTDGSTASSPASATRSVPPLSGRFCTAPASTRRRADPAPRGPNSRGAQAHAVLACDLFHLDTLTLRRLYAF